MIWLAGNHDSPGTVDTMRSIPGVTVLGTKTYHTTGYQVTAQYVDADGLVDRRRARSAGLRRRPARTARTRTA